MQHVITHTLAGAHGLCAVVLHEPDTGEFIAEVVGDPSSRYWTDSERDALTTAELLLADAEIHARRQA